MLAHRPVVAALFLALCSALPALAEEHPEKLHVHGAYLRVTGGAGGTGAVFFTIHNGTDQDDMLIGAATDAAARTELHTHVEDANGVMSMQKIEGGIALPSGDMAELARGGDHVMLMGLKAPLQDGDTISLTLTFEHAPAETIEVQVDNARTPDMDMNHSHGTGG
ncbi:MAG: copper chaperone PCu(A)C [Tabrizicola sp.]|nr:copper chaperone PCu(A)C [Tabrizicola sp.]